MKILLLNVSNTYNYGSMMMGENFISYFNKISGIQNQYYVETEDETKIERLKQATGIDQIYFVKMNST